MKQTPLPVVSVVIATYNGESFLRRTVRSVLSQSYTNIEVIVVDDGSTDGTRHLMDIECSQDARLRYIYQDNQERGAARNRGISESHGEFIAFIDQDDLWHPDKLARQVTTLLEDSCADCCYCARGVWHHDGRRTYEEDVTPPAGDIFEPLLSRCFIGSMTPLVRRSCIVRVGGFCEDRRLSCFCDWELWTRLAVCYKWAYIAEFLGTHCLHGGNTQRALEWHEDELRIHLMSLYNLSKQQREALHRYSVARRWHWATALYNVNPIAALTLLLRICRHSPRRLMHKNIWGLAIRSGLYAMRYRPSSDMDSIHRPSHLFRD